MNLSSEKEVRKSFVRMLEKFQSRFNRGRFNDLEKLFSPDAVLVIAAGQRMLRGSRRAKDFWRSLKRRGLRDLRIKLEKMQFQPVEEIIRTKKGFQRVDLVVDFVCRLDYFNSPTPGSMKAFGRAGHMEDCNFGLRSVFII